MKIKYMNSVIFVEDVDRSRQFYTNVLGQKVIQDYGRYVGFDGGFGIWDREYAMSIIFCGKSKKPSSNSGQMELYFETDDLDAMIQHLKSHNVILIHELYTHDWGQRGFRIQDPDGIIVEIGEPIAVVIQRFYEQGLSTESIAEKTGMSISEIESYQ